MVTSSIHEAAKNIQELNLCPDLHCDLDILAVHKFEVRDCCEKTMVAN